MRLIKAPTEEEVLRLIEAAETSTLTGMRDRAWLELAYSTGARRSEMFRLSVHDLDFEQKTVRLYGKGDKERILPLGTRAGFWLKRYLTEARPKLLGQDGTAALWIGFHSGRPLGYEAIRQRLRIYAAKAGLPIPALTAHSLRRACATHMLQHGASSFLLQKLLGHERTGTLGHYLKLTIQDVKQTHQRSKPGR